MTENTITRRTVLGATGAAAAAAVGAVGSAAAGPMECVQTSTDAEASDSCGAPHVTTIDAGRSGFVQNTCTSDGIEYKEVDFDCTDLYWVASSDLESASDCFC